MISENNLREREMMKSEVVIDLLKSESHRYTLFYFRYDIAKETILFMLSDEAGQMHVGYLEEIWDIQQHVSSRAKRMLSAEDGVDFTINEKEIVLHIDPQKFSCVVNQLEIGERSICLHQNLFQKINNRLKRNKKTDLFHYNVKFDFGLIKYAVHTRYFVFQEKVRIKNGKVDEND